MLLPKEYREELEELHSGLHQELMSNDRVISDMSRRQDKLRKELWGVEDVLGLTPGLGASAHNLKDLYVDVMEGMAMHGVKPDTVREFYSENDVTTVEDHWHGATGLELHKAIGIYLTGVYAKKNSDYGDAFGKSIDKHGMKAAIVRMEDKLGRLDALTSGTDQQVFDEKLEDTVLDLANYAIMTAMYMIEKGR